MNLLPALFLSLLYICHLCCCFFHSFSLSLSVSIASDINRLQTTKPYVCSAGCLTVNPHRSGCVENSTILFPTFPEFTQLYVFFPCRQWLSTYCLFCTSGTETRLRHGFCSFNFLNIWLGLRFNCQCNSAWIEFPALCLFLCAPPLDSQDGSRGLCPRRRASSWINTTSEPWSAGWE